MKIAQIIPATGWVIVDQKTCGDKFKLPVCAFALDRESQSEIIPMVVSIEDDGDGPVAIIPMSEVAFDVPVRLIRDYIPAMDHEEVAEPIGGCLPPG